jgi:hypothetical protein
MHEVPSIGNHSLNRTNDPADTVRCCGECVVLDVKAGLCCPSSFSASLQYYWTLWMVQLFEQVNLNLNTF